MSPPPLANFCAWARRTPPRHWPRRPEESRSRLPGRRAWRTPSRSSAPSSTRSTYSALRRRTRRRASPISKWASPAPAVAISAPAPATHAWPSGEVVGAVLTLGIVCTALAFLLFFALIREIGPVRSTVITYVNPAVAVTLGVILLHERLTGGIAVGFVLILRSEEHTSELQSLRHLVCR